MSSRYAENQQLQETPQRPRRPWSLTAWFALSNAVSAFVILALISSLLYLGLVSQLKTQNHYYLHEEVTILEAMFRDAASSEDLADEINPDQHGKEYIKHYIRLLDRKGLVLSETAGMAEAAPHSRFTLPVRDGRPGIDEQWSNADGALVLGTSSWVNLGGRNGELGILEVALDVTNVQSILEGYRRKIYAGLLLGFMVCVVVSSAIARRGTRPLREMTEAVSRISVANLEERISGGDWPTELKTLAVTMNEMLDRLQDSFQRLYNSARNLSHKMRTPLTIQRGEAELALARERTVEELQNVIASGLEENGRLVRLIDNILFLAEAEMGKLKPNPALLDLREELDKVVDFYTPYAEEKGVTLTCRGNATVMADAALFRKLSASLLYNAIIYNCERGTVDLVLRQGEAGSGEFCVTDSGCGIAEEETRKIFDRFYRIYATRYLDPHGTGLGLPIAKAATDLHNGTIKVQSRPGYGTTVTVCFPPAAV